MSLLGVLVLNLLFLFAGSAVLWGVRGWTDWREYGSLGGIAYITGLSTVSVIATLIPIWGGSLDGGTIVGIAAAVGVVGLAVGVANRRPRPRRVEDWSLHDISALVPVGLALVCVALLASFFRAARTSPLTTWDAWAFWMTKAKAIYYFGGLDASYFHHLAGPSYPILVPTLSAMDFRFMGSADTTTLGVQWWLIAVGFVWAAAGLLRDVAPPTLTWLFLALFVTIPELDRRLLSRTGDWPLDTFFALSACALIAWIAGGQNWLLAVYGITLAATLATKREGQLLLLTLVVAGIAAVGIRSRRSWLGIVGVAALASLTAVPWRIWWTSRHLQSNGPPGGLLHATFANIDKAPQAFHLVFRLLFEYQLWLAITPVALVAALAGLWLENPRIPAFFLIAFVLGFVGWAWTNWVVVSAGVPISTDSAVNPTDRAVGSLVLLSVVAAPILVGQLLAQRAATRDQARDLANTTGSASASATNA